MVMRPYVGLQPMRLKLEVVSGPSSGKTVALEPGHVTRFGRTGRAEVAFPDDAHMSAVHFAIEFDAHECRIRDLNSRNGTFLNGDRVNFATLKPGDQVLAGRTAFAVRPGDEAEASLGTSKPAPSRVSRLISRRPGSVRREGHEAVGPKLGGEDENVGVSSPRRLWGREGGCAGGAAQAPAQVQELTPAHAALDRLVAMFRGGLQPLFAVLDAARDPAIADILASSKEHYESLSDASEGDGPSHFVPYLARLPETSALLEILVRQGWGNNWGVYLKSDKGLKEVRSHIRRFLTVKLPEGREVYFRYYDPRVLRLFLPTCTADEVNRFFGPVTAFLMEAEEPDILLEFTNYGHGAEKISLPLSPAL